MADLNELKQVLDGMNKALAEQQKMDKTALGNLFKHRSDFDTDKVFKALDVSGNGTLEAEEFEDLLAMSSFFDSIDKDKSGSLNEEEINSYFTNNENIDINMTTELADGKVTLTEFIIAMNEKIDVGGKDTTRINIVKQSFGPYKEYQAAKAGKGKISKETLKKIYAGVSSAINVDELLGDKDGLTIEEDLKLLGLLRYFKAMDKDSSGFINAKEIKNFLSAAEISNINADDFLDSLDRNNDDRVSFTEFYQVMLPVY